MSIHLVILTPGFPEDEGDSSCIPPLQDFVRSLAISKTGWEINVIAFQYPYRRGIYSWHGIQVYSAGGKNQKGIKKIQTWTRIANYLISLNRQKSISLIHSFWLGECALAGNLAGKWWKVPHICTLMGQDARPGNKYFRLGIHPAQLVCLSEFHRNSLRIASGIEAQNLIPWGIICDSFPPVNNNRREIDILGVGSLIEGKNYLDFLRIIGELRKHIRDFRVCIIGEGPQRELLETHIRLNELENHVHLLGGLPRDQVLGLMNNSKILVHTSEYESYGMVLIEALYMGMYVCCTHLVGILHPLQRWQEASAKLISPSQLPTAIGMELVHERIDVPFINNTLEAYARLYQSRLSE